MKCRTLSISLGGELDHNPLSERLIEILDQIVGVLETD